MTPREDPFPHEINALTDLPEEFKQAIHTSLPEDESILSILMLPPQPFMKRGGIPRQVLLSTTHGIFHVQDGKPPLAIYLPAESLLYVHHKLILLYGSLELAGVVNGRLIRIIAEYNTAGQPLLDNALRQFLQIHHGKVSSETDAQEQNNDILNDLGKESFKFMNGLRFYALQSNERLLGYVFQPRIQRPFLRFFNRAIAPVSMLALSDKNVILIEEDKVRGAAYGWVITLCPRNVILTIESKPVETWQKLSVILLKDQVNVGRSLILEPEKASACTSLWASQTSPQNEIQ